jgi:hypothetical protein
MSDLASELFGTVSQGDTDGHPLAGLENHPYFQQQAATTTTSESVADRPTTRQITVTLPTLRLPSKPARPARSPIFWIVAIASTIAFPPAILLWLWLMRIPPTAT